MAAIGGVAEGGEECGENDEGKQGRGRVCRIESFNLQAEKTTERRESRVVLFSCSPVRFCYSSPQQHPPPCRFLYFASNVVRYALCLISSTETNYFKASIAMTGVRDSKILGFYCPAPLIFYRQGRPGVYSCQICFSHCPS